jgi:UDP-N-acetylmuramyl pentapeptide phosphotransferase/UDP-N-acetylglucosamine-1-phosphate transferase
VSLFDDARALPVLVRLAAHLAAAGVAAWTLWPGATVGAVVVLTLAIAWMSNLYNFMDGSDGLAGGMAAIGFAAHAAAAQAFGAESLALACAATAGASLGFLGHNFPPARVFLGDAGSVPLGFLAAALGAVGAVEGAWPAWFPVLVFSPFILDATVTLLRRAAARERLWAAHRSHYYQRLVLAGWSKRRLVLGGYLLMALAAASALFARRQGFLLQCGTIVVWAAVYLLLLVAIDRLAPCLGAKRTRGDSGTPR